MYKMREKKKRKKTWIPCTFLDVPFQDAFDKALEHAQLVKAGVRGVPRGPLVRDERDFPLVHKWVVDHQQPFFFQHLVRGYLPAVLRQVQVEKGAHGHHMHAKENIGGGRRASMSGACSRGGGGKGCLGCFGRGGKGSILVGSCGMRSRGRHDVVLLTFIDRSKLEHDAVQYFYRTASTQ